MATQYQMEISYTAQHDVVMVLRNMDEPELADRLDRCARARRERHYGDGWPYSCRSIACAWCRRAMIRGWWNGMCSWAVEASASSLAIIPTDATDGLIHAARRLRRGLRDVRDRTARRARRWRTVAFAGIMGGDGTAFVMICHDDLERHELLTNLCGRRPGLHLKDLEQEMPVPLLTPLEAAELGRRHRGIEPLRVVIMPQRDAPMAKTSCLEPMPILLG
jgi:hypothetical protein